MAKKTRLETKVLVDGGLDRAIHLISGKRVMLESDLAAVYGVKTKRLVEQARRNAHRFPEDFMFLLSNQEVAVLLPQNAAAKLERRGGRRSPTMAFTEHGAVMLASVLNSPVAVAASVEIVRAFIRLRTIASEHRDLLLRVDALEERYDGQFKNVFDAIRKLMSPPPEPKPKIGFGR